MSEVSINLGPFRRNLGNATLFEAMLANLIIEDSEMYVPMLTGQLARSYTVIQYGGHTQIVYDVPYARYLYYGLAMDWKDHKAPNHGKGWKKVVAVPHRPLKYTFNQHPEAGSHWVQRALVAYGPTWRKKVGAAIASQGA